MVVALIALVMSMTGGAIAAVNFARNAGAVDGKSAVKASSSNKKARGKLVAMDTHGKLPFKFLSGAASSKSVSALAKATPGARNGARLTAVPDNTSTTADTLVDMGLGALQVSCVDQSNQASKEDAATRVTIANTSGAAINIARRVGVAAPEIATLENATTDTFDVGGTNTFSVQVQGGEKTVLVEGTARQIGQNTADSACAVWATAILAG